MIDIENKVTDTIIAEVQKVYPSCFVSSIKLRTVSDLPCVSIVETNNSVYKPSRTLNCLENHASLTYEVEVFTNIDGGQKEQAKAILSVVDDTMNALGFERTFKSPIPDEDITIYRMIARYESVCSKGMTENNKTVYKNYRK